MHYKNIPNKLITDAIKTSNNTRPSSVKEVILILKYIKPAIAH